ncbi:hypothetical protein KFE25_011711 [Diacronema lutheri]|uniref:RNA exonuclease 4 n=1 Tax=Diacronema lutheri TaxID=2081491 RepID=A0A8J6C5J0_DIALT|nr:hypothetical protein KFE25_011711 [Diacronema lutheri]
MVAGSSEWIGLAALAAVLLAHGAACCLVLLRLTRRLLGTRAVRERLSWLQACARRLRERRVAPAPDESRGTACTSGAMASAPASGPRPPRHVRPTGPLRVPAPLSADASLTDVVALDCEMVGVGSRGLFSSLACVCVVNYDGVVLLSTLVRPREPVIDYRTRFSGVTREMLEGDDARPFGAVRSEVMALLDGRICVGHSVHNDFIVLGINHPAHLTRDTAHDLRRLKNGSRPRKLKHLAAEYLGLKIQTGQHDAAEDARATLYLYRAFRDEFEHVARRRAARAAARRDAEGCAADECGVATSAPLVCAAARGDGPLRALTIAEAGPALVVTARASAAAR